jgi:hypothetical protein
MGKWTVAVGMAALVAFAAVTPAAAQTRARVSGSEPSYSSGPNCVIAGVASDCAGSAAPTGVLLVPHLVVGPPPMVGSMIGVVPGDARSGHASNDVDVDRSARDGTAVAR